MKAKRLAYVAFIAIGLGAVVTSPSPLVANSEIQQPDPVALLQANHKPIAQGVGWVFASPDRRVKSMIDVRTGSGMTSDRFCSGYSDASCPATSYTRMVATILLGRCESVGEEACLESVSTVNESGQRVPMTFVSGGEKVFDAATTMFGPKGTTATKWRAADGTMYVVVPQASIWGTSSEGQWKSQSINWFNLYVRRISASDASNFMNNESPAPLEFVPGSRFAVQMRLPASFPLWFQARLTDGVVKSTKLASGSYSHEFSGSPAAVPIPTVQADYTKNPEIANGLVPNGFQVSSIEPGNSVRSFKMWANNVDEKAIATIRQWSVGSYAATAGSCFKDLGGFAGLMATNAGSYGQEPPTFDRVTGQMKIEVGSSHLDETGAVVVGTYAASIPMVAVECLYGEGFVPTEAEVSVAYQDGSATFTSSQSLKVVDDQVNIAVSGFHYSVPTISLRLKSSSNSKTLKRKSSTSLSSIAKTTKAQKAQWKATGACKVSGTRLIASSKAGKCTVTLRVLNNKKKYVVKTTRVFTVK